MQLKREISFKNVLKIHFGDKNRQNVTKLTNQQYILHLEKCIYKRVCKMSI